MNKKPMKEIIHIIVIIILSLMLGALFLRIEELNEEIPNQVHALLEVTIRDTIKEEFERQELKGNVFLMQ